MSLYDPPTLTAHVEPVDSALVAVRLYLGGRSAGYCELSPALWRLVRHALAVGLTMTGGRLAVETPAPRPYHHPLALTPDASC